MARKRFNKDEKEIIAEALPIQWQNVTQWHNGLLIGNIEQNEWGWQTVLVHNQEDTRTVGIGPIPVGPGHLRHRPAGARPSLPGYARHEFNRGDNPTGHDDKCVECGFDSRNPVHN